MSKIDQIEQNYVHKISKAELIVAVFFELLKDLPEHEQKQFLVQNLSWLSKQHPTTHHNFLKKSLVGVSKVLDDYSSYLPPEQFKKTIQLGQGRIAGIGIELFEKNGMVEVVGIMPNSPAALAKLKVGDLITHINGVEVEPKKEDIIQKLRGNIGSTATLTIQRGAKVFNINVVRQMIKIQPISYAVYKDVLYLRLNYFTRYTYQDMKKILKHHQCVKGCILDLRNNPGGLFQQGVLVAGLFLQKGVEILKVQERAGEKLFCAYDHDHLAQKPLVLLINRATASSAEIVAGGLKDAKRAVLIGEKTLGKGSIQDMKAIFPSVFFGGFKYTVAEFFTSSGRIIQNNGIEPDFYVYSDVSYHSDPAILNKTDLQFQKGMEILG